MNQPLFVVLAGPNGSGKSTAAATLFPSSIAFVNADEIAKGLPGYLSGGADVEAARIALDWMDRLQADRADFAVETTLASRSLACRAGRVKGSGYHFRLLFLWSPNPEFSVSRVAARVAAGGHHVPGDVIRRRYRSGLANFRGFIRPLADSWVVYDNTTMAGPMMIAEGHGVDFVRVVEPKLWALFEGGGFP